MQSIQVRPKLILSPSDISALSELAIKLHLSTSNSQIPYRALLQQFPTVVTQFETRTSALELQVQELQLQVRTAEERLNQFVAKTEKRAKQKAKDLRELTKSNWEKEPKWEVQPSFQNTKTLESRRRKARDSLTQSKVAIRYSIIEWVKCFSEQEVCLLFKHHDSGATKVRMKAHMLAKVKESVPNRNVLSSTCITC